MKSCYTIALLVCSCLFLCVSNGFATPYNAYLSHGSGQSSLIIEGPRGTEGFNFGFHVDACGPIFINSSGVVVAAAEATADPFIFAAIYGLGGYAGGFAGGNGLGSVSPNGAFHSLGWEWLGEDPTYLGTPSITGVSDSGVVTGFITFFSFDGQPYLMGREWDLGPYMPTPVPEPGTLLLLGTGLLGLAARRGVRKKD